jgi:hypothetical protein
MLEAYSTTATGISTEPVHEGFTRLEDANTLQATDDGSHQGFIRAKSNSFAGTGTGIKEI